jgi:hypothetical protein
MMSARNNRWLGQYGRTLDATGKATLAEAMDRRDEHTAAKIKAGANPIHLSGPWGEFADFHNVRKIEEGLQGNKYGVGAISGGGDINQRSLDGKGPTTEIFSPARAMATGTAPTARSRGTAMLPAAARPTTNVTDDAPTWLMQLRQDAEAAQLRDSMHASTTGSRLRQQGMTDRALAALDMSKRGPGTQGGNDFAMGQAAQNRQIASDNSWQTAADKSGQYWQYDEPREAFQHGRNLEITQARSAPAQIAADSRLEVQRMIQEGRLSQQQGEMFLGLLNATQRGEAANVGYNQPRADQLGGAFDALRSQAPAMAPGANRRPSLPAAASPTAGMSRNPRIPPGTPSQQGPDGMYYLDPQTGEYVHEEDF